ncbi:MAG: hypothetical protein RR425_06780, partial [Erysipelotrichales bacterium]
MNNAYKQAIFINPYTLKLRRYFHMYPELSNQEYFTHNKIIEELKAMKVEYKIVGDYSIVASITKGKSKKKIAFRCEMDAL